VLFAHRFGVLGPSRALVQAADQVVAIELDGVEMAGAG
jgi:hypothetical protein